MMPALHERENRPAQFNNPAGHGAAMMPALHERENVELDDEGYILTQGRNDARPSRAGERLYQQLRAHLAVLAAMMPALHERENRVGLAGLVVCLLEPQ